MTRPLRRDAKRNREKILDAARQGFADHGMAVPLQRIAAEAGVSVGTLYHHFTDRDHLVDQALLPLVEQSVARARQALSDPDVQGALFAHLESIAAWQARDRAFTDICVTSLPPDCAIEQAKAEGHRLTEELVERSQRAGVLRDDVTLADIGLLVWSVVKATEGVRSSEPEAWRRHLHIVLDGLRPAAATTLPAGGLDTASTQRAMAT